MCFSSATGWHNRKPAEAFQDNIFAKMDSRLRIKSDLTDELLSQGVWRIRRTRLRQNLEGRPITFCCVCVHYDDFWCASKKKKQKKNTPKSYVLLPVLHVSSLSFTQPLIQACQFVFSTFARRVEAKHKKKQKKQKHPHVEEHPDPLLLRAASEYVWVFLKHFRQITTFKT